MHFKLVNCIVCKGQIIKFSGWLILKSKQTEIEKAGSWTKIEKAIKRGRNCQSKKKRKKQRSSLFLGPYKEVLSFNERNLNRQVSRRGIKKLSRSN